MKELAKLRGAVTNSSRILASLLRRVLDFLACFLDACANVVDSVVNAATSAFHRASRTMTADDRQCQYNQCEDAFHVLKYNLVVRDFNSQQIGLEILSGRSQGAAPFALEASPGCIQNLCVAADSAPGYSPRGRRTHGGSWCGIRTRLSWP